jgi:hypothetical protein
VEVDEASVDGGAAGDARGAGFHRQG